MNLVRIYADRKLAVSLDGYIARDSDWSAAGYPATVQKIGAVDGKVFAIPFAVSTPTLFFNLDLVKRAGGNPDKLPTDWPEIIALAKEIDALDNNISGIYYDYAASGAFAFETLLFSRGGAMMSPDEKTLLINGPEGQWTMDMLRRFGEAGQVDMSRNDALQAFVAGTLGIYWNTSSLLGNFDKNIGDRFSYRHDLHSSLQKRPSAGRRQRHGYVQRRRCAPRSRLEIHQVRFEPERPGDHGEEERMCSSQQPHA
ncbi:extracellular solute-binding protein [Sinorhizobium meliloti]|nr:extracellular solute-binding protein [Sinorhizobium meliloti]RVN44878.1 extracellular solute-binding protein [Sinorhizobium meliloti]